MTAVSWIFLLFTAALGVTRSALELTLIEPLTGFYAHASSLVLVHNILYVVGVALLLLLLKKSPSGYLLNLQGRARALGALLFAAGVVLGASSLIVLCLDTVAFAGGSGSVPLLILLAEAAGIAAAAAMIIPAIGLFSAGEYRGGLLCGAVCAAWLALEMIARFMAYQTIASISGQTLEVVALCMGALFWLSHARIASDGKLEPSGRYAKLWALLFSFFSVTLCVGQLAAILAGRGGACMTLPRLSVLLLLGFYAAVWSGALTLVDPPAPDDDLPPQAAGPEGAS